jgi:hypothetical protein
MKKLTPFFIPNSHKCICELGMTGQQHGRNVSDVDKLLALQAGDVLNVRWRIAKRSRSPQMSIFSMLLTVQEKRAKTAQ